ncbi:MAG: hypothetical protein STSR0007_13410 [Thermovirga sp.]
MSEVTRCTPLSPHSLRSLRKEDQLFNVLSTTFADTQDFPVALFIDPYGYENRDVSDLASPTLLEPDTVEKDV